MARRRSPRLHIRFEDFGQMDKVERCAHRQGEKIVPWARRALIKQARLQTTNEKIAAAAHYAALESVAILREIAGPEITKTARLTVKDFLVATKKEAANEFG